MRFSDVAKQYRKLEIFTYVSLVSVRYLKLCTKLWASCGVVCRLECIRFKRVDLNASRTIFMLGRVGLVGIRFMQSCVAYITELLRSYTDHECQTQCR